MRKVLLLLISAVFFATISFGQSAPYILYEDFEFGTTGQQPWNPLNGAVFSVIDNPDLSPVNPGGKVGSVTNNPDSDFSFLLANTGSRINLSEYNQFKITVWSPQAGVQFLFKIEGGRQQIERFVPITVANEWVEYTIDLSGGSGLTKINTLLLAIKPLIEGGDEKTY